MYREDILRDGFQQRVITLRNDYEGKVISTLIRRLSPDTSHKAVLYIHGFNDYFFQKEMAFRFNGQGYNFFALDLRKYGRSYLNHQKLNDVRNLKDYFEEIRLAIEYIYREGNRNLFLLGHSTGGLILTLFAKEYSAAGIFSGLILNSPFFEFNQPCITKHLIPLAAYMGKFFPKIEVSGGFTEEYGKNLHKSFDGEWDYDLKWKPNVAPKVNLGWINAILEAQNELKEPFEINKPVLILHSAKSATNVKDKNQIRTRDAILNVKDIDKIAQNIKGDVEIIAIEGGLHDLILSPKEVRDVVYKSIFEWIDTKSSNK